jgi:hypothetical protein
MTTAIQLARVDSVNLGPIAGFRNLLINGAFDIWQRGTSSATAGYLADRWRCVNINSQLRSTDVPAGFRFSLEYGHSSATYPFAEQRIEAANARHLVGHNITISFWAKSVSGSSNLYIDVCHPNAEDNYTTETTFHNIVLSASPSTSWTFYSLTVTNLPAGVANGLAFKIVRNNASAATTRICGVQLEHGVVATSFERRSFGIEELLCYRYFWRTDSGGVQALVRADSSGQAHFTAYYFPVPMRIVPTASGNFAGTFNGTPAVTSVTRTHLIFYNLSAAAGFSYTYYANNNTIDAEL